jgi:hypothetical protein
MVVGTTDITTSDGARHPAFVELKKSQAPAQMIILCVDSIAARKGLIETLLSHGIIKQYTIIIDTGNEDHFGQVKLCGGVGAVYENQPMLDNTLSEIAAMGPAAYEKVLGRLPFDANYFYDMQPPAVEASCADLDQTMAVNCLVANTVFSVVQNIYYRNPVYHHRFNVNIMHGVHTEGLNLAYLVNTAIKSRAYKHKDMSSDSANVVYYRHGYSIHPLLDDIKAQMHLFLNPPTPVPEKKVRKKKAVATSTDLLGPRILGMEGTVIIVDEMEDIDAAVVVAEEINAELVAQLTTVREEAPF